MRTRLGSVIGLSLGLALLACAGGSSDDPPRRDAANGDLDAPAGACQGGCSLPDKCCEIGGNWFCINTANDPNNCGDCGATCDPMRADSCAGSQCKCDIAPACTGDYVCCTGGPGLPGCKDLQNDPQNCGACGRACATNESCSNGDCVCAGEGAACGAGETCCPSGCANTTNDNANCGQCGTACDTAAGEQCVGSQCTCGGGAVCGAQEDCCGSACINICTDVNNCGGCGTVCPGGADDICFFGSCASVFPPAPLPQCM